MACTGGRAPPGRNTRTPCAGSHWPAAVPGSRVQAPSASQPYLSSGRAGARCRARLASPTHSASAQYNRSSLLSTQSSASGTDTPPRDPAPSVPLAPELQAKIGSSSCLSSLHLLKGWSLRQTRGGSVRDNSIRCRSACVHGANKPYSALISGIGDMPGCTVT
jgi:hypothetical protein